MGRTIFWSYSTPQLTILYRLYKWFDGQLFQWITQHALAPMYQSQLFILCLATCIALVSTSVPPKSYAPSAVTIFHVASGDNDNYFYRDNVTTAQLLLTNASPAANTPRRFVVALPAGNNGALVYFLPKDPAQSLNVQLVNKSLTSISVSGLSKGIQADLQFSTNATFGVTIIGAVRAMRG